MTADEIWLVWLRDGEWGDTNLMDPAHRSREGAIAWCNENRKLSGGDPIQWKSYQSSEITDSGESGHITLDLGKSKHVTTRTYLLQVMKLE